MTKLAMRLFECVLIYCAASCSFAQDPESVLKSLRDANGPAQPGSASEDQAHVTEEQPQLEIAFDVSDAEEELRLFRADPDLLNQRFVAYVDFSAPGLQSFRPSGPWWNLAMCENFNLIAYGVNSPHRSLRHFLVQLTSACEDVLPASVQSVEFFRSDAAGDGRIAISEVEKAPGKRHFRFRILAPDAELARERSEALIRMLDHAIKAPLLHHMQDEMTALAAELDMLNHKLAASLEAGKELDERFTRLSESAVDSDELKRLTTERRLLDVDLAGIRARIDTSESILAKLNRNSVGEIRRIEKLEDIKISAEIDLAGVAARRKVLDQIIEEGKEREKVTTEVDEAHSEIVRIRDQIKSRTNRLQECREAFVTYAEETFSLIDDKIVIHPIKWTGTE